MVSPKEDANALAVRPEDALPNMRCVFVRETCLKVRDLKTHRVVSVVRNCASFSHPVPHHVAIFPLLMSLTWSPLECTWQHGPLFHPFQGLGYKGSAAMIEICWYTRDLLVYSRFAAMIESLVL
jgi:hypothetical protein